MKRGEIIAVIMVCLALAFGVSCRPGGGDSTAETPGETAPVTRGDLTVSVSGSGTIAVHTDVKLAFEKGGMVSKIYVVEGDAVVASQALALLEPTNKGSLELAVTQAEAALAQAEYSLDKAENPYTDEEIEDAREAVDDAEDWLDLTDEMLHYAIKSGDSQQITQWQMEDLKAENQLDTAKETLDDMLNERDENQIAVLKQQVAAAQKALDEARDALEPETLLAPFPGVVAAVYLDEGEVVSSPSVAQIPIVRLIDITNLEIEVSLDEIDAPNVVAGERAIINVDALPDAEFEGQVISIAPLPTIEGGVVSYPVKVTFTPPQGQGIRVGMSATADIVTAERRGILLVPDGAINADAQGNSVVRVVVLGGEREPPQITDRTIVTGLSDGFQTEVISGLNEGETVLLETPSAPTQPVNGIFFGG